MLSQAPMIYIYIYICVLYYRDQTFSASIYSGSGWSFHEYVLLSHYIKFLNLSGILKFTATGATGMNGPTVTNPVMADLGQGNAHVITQHQLLVGKTAKVYPQKWRAVIWQVVQVRLLFYDVQV